MKFVVTILEYSYEVEANNYTTASVRGAQKFIEAHGLAGIKPTNLIGLCSMRKVREPKPNILEIIKEVKR